ncbi:GAP family protein [Streptomyces sp. NPDC086080]|uniref:GAP family protein n=1 Tax=Streptomyces sp. NPDC086080 TaxID=3365748 RepID=UPI0037D0A0BC
MGEAIGQILSYGVAVALSPFPVIGVMLMLATPRARSNGPALLLGWVLGLALVGTIVLLVSGGAGPAEQGQPAGWVSALDLALGVLLLWVAVKEWRGRPRGDEEAELPRSWWATPSPISPPESAGPGRTGPRARGCSRSLAPRAHGVSSTVPVSTGRSGSGSAS